MANNIPIWFSRWGALTAGLLLVCACASGSTGSSSSARSGSRDVITRRQMEELGLISAYDAVRRISPAWLRPRMTTAGEPAPIRVYMDNVRVGNVEYLEQVRTEIVDRLVYYSPSDATTKWGTGNTGGAIEVITRR